MFLATQVRPGPEGGGGFAPASRLRRARSVRRGGSGANRIASDPEVLLDLMHLLLRQPAGTSRRTPCAFGAHGADFAPLRLRSIAQTPVNKGLKKS